MSRFSTPLVSEDPGDVQCLPSKKAAQPRPSFGLVFPCFLERSFVEQPATVILLRAFYILTSDPILALPIAALVLQKERLALTQKEVAGFCSLPPGEAFL